MTNKSISQLSSGAAVAATDLFPDVQTAGVGPVKVTADQIKTFTSASPTLVTPTIGVASGTSLALGGATIGSNAFAVTGTSLFTGSPTLVTPSTSTANYFYWNNGSVNVAAFGGFSDSATAGHLEFYTTTASVLTTRMRINSDGRIGFGTTANTFSYMAISPTATGQSFEDVVNISATLASDVTGSGRSIQSRLTTGAAAAYNSIIHFYVNPAALFSGSTVSLQYGFYAESTISTATTNYGFYSGNTAAITSGKTSYAFYSAANIATGGGTTWAVYTAGTAPSLFGGSLVVGGAALSTSATEGFLYLPTCAGAPVGTPTTRTGTVATIYDTTNNYLYIYNGGWKKVLLS